jgi:hypothetical protein
MKQNIIMFSWINNFKANLNESLAYNIEGKCFLFLLVVLQYNFYIFSELVLKVDRESLIQSLKCGFHT